MPVRHFQLELKAIGPIHIGNGEKYGKKDYFEADGEIAILDVNSFIQRLSPSQMSEYCNFLEDQSRQVNLQRFLKDKKLFGIAKKSIMYSIDTPLATARRGSVQYYDVFEFVKDSYGHPYIPGSSVKGAIRTALLTALLRDDPYACKDFDSETAFNKRDAKKADRKLIRKTLWTEQPDKNDQSITNDIMKYVSVSDSEPLSLESLVFVKKYDKFSKADAASHKCDMGQLSDYEGNELNIYRECLRPGTVVNVAVDVDERIDAYLGFALDNQGLLKIFKDSYDVYKKCFLDYFDIEEDSLNTEEAPSDGDCNYIYASGPFEGRRCPNKAVGQTGFCNIHKAAAQRNAKGCDDGLQSICYIGGGIDFDEKTVVNAVFENDDKRVDIISHILYAQFPTKADPDLHSNLIRDIRESGYRPDDRFEARWNRDGSLKKGKDDHRHWQDSSLGVSPHALKLGILGKKKYPMGKCELKIRER